MVIAGLLSPRLTDRIIGGSKGAPGTGPGPIFFHFYAIFGQKIG